MCVFLKDGKRVELNGSLKEYFVYCSWFLFGDSFIEMELIS